MYCLFSSGVAMIFSRWGSACVLASSGRNHKKILHKNSKLWICGTVKRVVRYSPPVYHWPLEICEQKWPDWCTLWKPMGGGRTCSRSPQLVTLMLFKFCFVPRAKLTSPSLVWCCYSCMSCTNYCKLISHYVSQRMYMTHVLIPVFFRISPHASCLIIIPQVR